MKTETLKGMRKQRNALILLIYDLRMEVAYRDIAEECGISPKTLLDILAADPDLVL